MALRKHFPVFPFLPVLLLLSACILSPDPDGSDADANAARTGSAVCEAKAPGKCLYVHPQGDDAGSGSLSEPLRRPQEAVRRARPGDVIYLRGGTYTDAHAYAVRPSTSSSPARRFLHVGDVRNESESWQASSGTAESPITVKSYPGERAVAKNAGPVSFGSFVSETGYWNLEDITLDGHNILIGGGSRGADGKPTAQTHHIAIRGCEIMNHKEADMENAGLIKIDRGDWGGPSDILIENNRLHDLYALGCEGCPDAPGTYDWKTVRDFAHFGAVTTLSCESYVDPACGGNGALTLRKNVFYNVPMVLFFKNPTRGPVVVEDNVFYNARSLGRVAGSNTRIERNVAYGIETGFIVGGYGGSTVPALYAISGRNFTLQNNTLAGVNEVVKFNEYGSGHVVRRNVVFGLAQRASAANFNTPGFLSRYLSDADRDDPGSSLSQSELAQGNDFNDNCLVSPHDDFLTVTRYRPKEGGQWPIDFLTMEQARQAFGFETRSRVLKLPDDAAGRAAVFINPAVGDYRIRSDSPCAGMGAHAGGGTVAIRPAP